MIKNIVVIHKWTISQGGAPDTRSVHDRQYRCDCTPGTQDGRGVATADRASATDPALIAPGFPAIPVTDGKFWFLANKFLTHRRKIFDGNL